jgi:tryptophan 2,3-dioxygenase
MSTRHQRPLEDGIVRDFKVNLSYGQYLHLDEILAAQHPVSTPEHHDELLFILQHQTSELWLKLVLHELREVQRRLAADELRPALKGLARV